MYTNNKPLHVIKTIIAMALLALSGLDAMAQQQGAPEIPFVPEPSPYSDPIFYIMSTIAIILLIFIMQLSKLFSGIVKNVVRKDQGIDKTMMITLLLSLSLLTPVTSSAAAALVDQPMDKVPFMHHGFGSTVMNVLAFIIILELSVVLYYTYLIRSFLVKEKEEAPYVEKVKSAPFWDRFHKSVAIEQEAAILTGHDYDGIKELDNSLPPWWKYGFYLTILFSFVYLAHYHVFGTGSLQIAELREAEAEAAIELAAYEKLQENRVDEKTIVYLTGAEDLAAGKALFKEKTCFVCHGEQGQGINGPNLTDSYWIHGGTINAVFASIKYGIPEKGMRSWKAEIGAPQMAQISSYIMSLAGTNPPNPKEPQGILFNPTAATDSTQIAPTDSLKMVVDSTQAK